MKSLMKFTYSSTICDISSASHAHTEFHVWVFIKLPKLIMSEISGCSNSLNNLNFCTPTKLIYSQSVLIQKELFFFLYLASFILCVDSRVFVQNLKYDILFSFYLDLGVSNLHGYMLTSTRPLHIRLDKIMIPKADQNCQHLGQQAAYLHFIPMHVHVFKM